MRKQSYIAALAVLLITIAPVAFAAEKVLFEQDFESPEAAKTVTSKKTVLSAPGPESKHCISQSIVGAYNSLDINTDATIEEGAVLTFDYRTELRAGKLRYLGIYLFTAEGKHMIATVKPTDSWKQASVAVSKFRVDGAAKLKEPIAPGDTVNRIRFYGRGDDKTADQTVYIDNVRFVVK